MRNFKRKWTARLAALAIVGATLGVGGAVVTETVTASPAHATFGVWKSQWCNDPYRKVGISIKTSQYSSIRVSWYNLTTGALMGSTQKWGSSLSFYAYYQDVKFAVSSATSGATLTYLSTWCA